MMTEKARAPGRVAGLDLLRGLAALCVAIPHFFADRGLFPEQAETIAVLAVEVFFVLSGYVLAPQILFCLSTGQLRHLGIFIARRWMRTIPPYLVALLLISVVTRQIGTSDFLRYVFYVQNLFRQDNVTDYFAIAWSLSVEEWFYVTFPALLMTAAFIVRRRDLGFALAFSIAFCLLAAIARILFGDLDDWGGAVRRVVVFRLDSIAYGFLLYIAVESSGRDWIRSIPAWSLVIAAVAATALVCATLAQIAATGGQTAKQVFPFVAALFGSTAILCALRSESALARRPVTAQFALWLGRVSYSTYLFHIILIEMIVAALSGISIVTEALLFIAILFAFTTAFYTSFERPILARRPRYIAEQREPADLASESPGQVH
jgi:peptidoglycan/LPS O-acetylase OafA/YrhL